MKVASFFKKYKVKQREGKVYDPVRRKYVHATPEEYKLETTLKEYGINQRVLHRALEDARLTYKLYIQMGLKQESICNRMKESE